MKTHWLIGLAGMVLAGPVQLNAGSGPGSQSGTANYAAHEWGTFTSVQGPDGVPVRWNPFTRSDLPSFVYTRQRPFGDPVIAGHRKELQNLGLKDGRSWYQRMETPVIYFHSDQPLTVQATVSFPSGRITEWYPQAARFGPVFGLDGVLPDTSESFLDWTRVSIAPETAAPSVPLLRDDADNHYYAARAVRASDVKVSISSSKDSAVSTEEAERFLFYRGAGDFNTPLRVFFSDDDEIQIENTGTEPLVGLHVIEARGAVASQQQVSRLNPGEIRRLKLPQSDRASSRTEATDALAHSLSDHLTAAGLNPDEAAAMVSTWRDSWFEEDGVRVLYLLPRAWTDATLPLLLDPAPKELTRVMVGRAEVFTPAEVRIARAGFARYRGDRDGNRLATAFAGIHPRFQEALLTHVGDAEAFWLKTAAMFSCSIPIISSDTSTTTSTGNGLERDLEAAREALLSQRSRSGGTGLVSR